MRNQYGGNCYRCGLWVAPGTGYFEHVRFKDRKPGDPKWRTQHCYRTHNGGVTCAMAIADAQKSGRELPALALEYLAALTPNEAAQGNNTK